MSGQAFVPPFSIGQTLWLPSHAPVEEMVSCPVCAGQRFVTLILGDGEHVRIPCEGCGIGFDGPRGVVKEYTYTPTVRAFVIAAVVRFDEDSGRQRWTLRADDGSVADFGDLRAIESEAMAVAEANAKAQYERNMESRVRKKKDKRGGWTVLYHRQCIADLERQLAWHRAKVQSKGRP